MGGTVEVVMYGVEEPLANDYFEELHTEARRLQHIFDFFNPSSELSLLNKNRRMRVSDEMASILRKALEYSNETRGAYDISIGKQIMARKQGKSLPKISCSFRNILLEGNRVTLNHPDVLIDLGSIAKGYVGDRIIESMHEIGIESGFVDARGDMRTYGGREEVVRIQHPRDKNRTLNPIVVQDMAVATSGDYNQYYGSFDKSHIIGDTDFISATVVSEQLVDADALASCVFLLGTTKAGKFLEGHKDTKVFAIDKALDQHIYNDFQSLHFGGVECGV